MDSALFLGVLNIDMVLASGQKTIGNKIMGDHLSTHVGGYGSIQSIACRRAGVDSSVLGFVGKDAFGHDLIKSLEFEKVNHDLVMPVSEEKTGVSTIIVRPGFDNLYIDFLGANHCLDKKYIDSVEGQIKEAKFVSVHMDNTTFDSGFELLDNATSYGVPSIVNFSLMEPIPDELFKMRNVDYMVVSYRTAPLFCGYTINNLKGARFVASLLLSHVRKAVLFEMNNDGVLVMTQNGWNVIGVPKEKKQLVDYSGVSDFFIGVFVAEMIKTDDLILSIEKAQRAALFCGSSIGVYESFPSSEFLQTVCNN